MQKILLIFELLTGERLIKIVVAKTLEMCVLAEYNRFIIMFSFFLFDYKIRSETFIIFSTVMILDIFAIAFVHSKAILTLSVFQIHICFFLCSKCNVFFKLVSYFLWSSFFVVVSYETLNQFH